MQQNLSFLDVIKQYIEAGDIVLPVLSSAAMRVQQELVKKEPDMRVLENLICKDQSLSSQVLQMANSAFYHGLVEIMTIRAAIVRLGMREVGRITLLAATKNQFRSNNKELNILMHKLWQHSVGCALGVQWLSKRCKLDELKSHAFFAGLFHDVGKLFVLDGGGSDETKKQESAHYQPIDYGSDEPPAHRTGIQSHEAVESARRILCHCKRSSQ